MDKAKTETAILTAILEGYSTGNFDHLFAFMTDDYQHASFWVVEVIRGKENAKTYYSGKGETMRSSGSLAKGKYVKILSAPSRVRPNGVFRNGVRMLEDPVFLHRTDEGKKAVLLIQNTNGQDVATIAIPTMTKDGLLKQLLLTDPKYYTVDECVLEREKNQ